MRCKRTWLKNQSKDRIHKLHFAQFASMITV